MKKFNLEEIDLHDLDFGFDALRSYIKEEEYKSSVRDLVLKVKSKPEMTPMEVVNDQMILHKNDKSSLVLRLIEKNKIKANADKSDNRLVVFANNILIANIGPGTIIIRRYQTKSIHNQSVFSKDNALQFQGREIIKPGEIFRIKAGKDSVEIEDISDNCLQIEFSSMPLYPMVWYFDKESLAPIYAAAVRVNSSRLQLSMKAVSILKKNLKVENLSKLVDHSDYFIRWEALKLVIQQDFDLGVIILKTLVNDPHPHVRNAALKLTSQIP